MRRYTSNMDFAGNVLIPVFSILVPTVVAIWLARSERRAAAEERVESQRREAEQRGEEERRREEERTEEAIEHALDAMNNLVEAGYTDDVRKAAAIRLRAARNVSRIYSVMKAEDEPVADWIANELGVISGGLENRDAYFLPVNLEQIVWRSGHFSSTLIDWLSGRKDLAWFVDHVPVALEATEIPRDE